jgi:hypothetical protein
MRFPYKAAFFAAIATATLSFSFTSAPVLAQSGAVAATNSLSLAVSDLNDAKRILGGDSAQPRGLDHTNLRHRTIFDIDQAIRDIRGTADSQSITLSDVAPDSTPVDLTVPHGVLRLLSKADKLVRSAGSYGNLHDAQDRIHDAYLLAHEARDTRAW